MKPEDLPLFLDLKKAAAVSGFSYYFLRNGCISGEIANVKSGNKWLVNMPALWEKLDRESRAAAGK